MPDTVLEYLDQIEAHCEAAREADEHIEDGDMPKLCKMLREAINELGVIHDVGWGRTDYPNWWETRAGEAIETLDFMAQEAGE